MTLPKELGRPDSAAIGQEMHEFAADLYPICRSITGDGIRQTLAMIAERDSSANIRSTQ